MRKIQPPPEEDRLLTPAEATAELGVGVNVLPLWESQGQIAAVRTLGGHRRYRATEVARLKQERGRKAGTA